MPQAGFGPEHEAVVLAEAVATVMLVTPVVVASVATTCYSGGGTSGGEAGR